MLSERLELEVVDAAVSAIYEAFSAAAASEIAQEADATTPDSLAVAVAAVIAFKVDDSAA